MKGANPRILGGIRFQQSLTASPHDHGQHIRSSGDSEAAGHARKVSEENGGRGEDRTSAVVGAETLTRLHLVAVGIVCSTLAAQPALPIVSF